jgi:hypothetical protein
MSVDKYQTVLFDSYSVPRAFAFRTVSVKGYVDRFAVAADGQVVAVHRRCKERQAMILDPLHYLATLGRKPATLDHAPVFRDWKLPACFGLLRSELERIHGPTGGSRRIVKLQQLLGQHPLDRVAKAVAA